MPAAEQNHSISDGHPIWKVWNRIELLILHVCVLAISVVLLGAFWIQLVGGEYPCPLCLLQRMGFFAAGFGIALNLVLRAYLPDMENRLRTITELHTQIHHAFAEEGISIPFPQREVRMLSPAGEAQDGQ
ncbi:MAG: disulfide bond formation protein B [Planctomycetaceae bacterium]